MDAAVSTSLLELIRLVNCYWSSFEKLLKLIKIVKALQQRIS
jgi:hypothetical protein